MTTEAKQSKAEQKRIKSELLEGKVEFRSPSHRVNHIDRDLPLSGEIIHSLHSLYYLDCLFFSLPSRLNYYILYLIYSQFLFTLQLNPSERGKTSNLTALNQVAPRNTKTLNMIQCASKWLNIKVENCHICSS